jgi:hypothetical protein
MREYQERFGNVPEGLLKLCATWGESGRLLAALTQAVKDNKKIVDWEVFVPVRCLPTIE